MNTNQEQELVQAAVGEEKFINIIFASDQEMRTFYLHMAYLLSPQFCGLTCDETDLLKNLLRKQRRFLKLLQSLGCHPWQEGVSEIQTALGYYMIQPGIERARQLQVNASIGTHLQFLTLIASQNHITKHLEAACHFHCSCLRALLGQES